MIESRAVGGRPTGGSSVRIGSMVVLTAAIAITSTACGGAPALTTDAANPTATTSISDATASAGTTAARTSDAAEPGGTTPGSTAAGNSTDSSTTVADTASSVGARAVTTSTTGAPGPGLTTAPVPAVPTTPTPTVPQPQSTSTPAPHAPTTPAPTTPPTTLGAPILTVTPVGGTTLHCMGNATSTSATISWAADATAVDVAYADGDVPDAFTASPHASKPGSTGSAYLSFPCNGATGDTHTTSVSARNAAGMVKTRTVVWTFHY